MNKPKLNKSQLSNKEINFSGVLSNVMASQSINATNVNALAESINRGNAYVEAQKSLNDKCLTGPSKLTNEFKTKAA